MLPLQAVRIWMQHRTLVTEYPCLRLYLIYFTKLISHCGYAQCKYFINYFYSICTSHLFTTHHSNLVTFKDY